MRKYIKILTYLLAFVMVFSTISCDINSIFARLPYDIESWHEHLWDNWLLTYDEENVHLICSVCAEKVMRYPISQGLEIENGVLVGRGSCTDKYIVVPQGVSAIGEGALSHEKDILGVLLPESVTEIRDGAFEHCDGLQVINIPDGVTSIGDNAFFSCKALIGVLIPNSVRSIGRKAFSNCGYLEVIYYVGIEEEWDAVSKGKDWDKGAGKHIVEFKMIVGENPMPNFGKPSEGLDFRLNDNGDSYSLVGRGNCTDTEIIIPSVHEGLPVTEIWEHVWGFSEDITSIVIPDSVTYIYNHAFENCTALETVVLSNSITVIEDATFYGCSSLKNIVIPESVIEIGGKSFLGCESLTSIKIPDSVKIIDFGAFDHCTSLTSVKFGENTQIESIGFVAFQGCTALKSIVIPDTVKFIDELAFLYCEDIVVYCEAESKPYEWNSRWDNVQYDSDAKIMVVWGYKGE